MLYPIHGYCMITMKSGFGEWRWIFIVLDTHIYLFLDDHLLLYVKLAQLSSVEKT